MAPQSITVPTLTKAELLGAAERLGARAKQAYLDGEPDQAGDLAHHAAVLAKQGGYTESATALAAFAEAVDPSPAPLAPRPAPPAPV